MLFHREAVEHFLTALNAQRTGLALQRNLDLLTEHYGIDKTSFSS